MYRLTLLLFLWCAQYSLLAQDGDYSLGARSTAMSGTATTLADHWSTFNNPGALGTIEETSAFISYQNRYNVAGFHVIGGGFVYHQEALNIGAKYFRFGDDLFSQQMAGLVMANKFQKVSLGVGINALQSTIEGLQTLRKLAVELGGVAEITRHLHFGAHIFNLTHRQDHPTTMKAGISFRPSQSLTMNFEIEKRLQAREKVKAGIEYQIIERLFVRTGVNIQPNQLGLKNVKSTFGFGFITSSFLFDYAFATAGKLGVIHELSVSHKIKRR